MRPCCGIIQAGKLTEALLKASKYSTSFYCLLVTWVIALIYPFTAVGAEKVTYLILAETVEPIMIVRDGDPMAGGIMTDIVQLIFESSEHAVEPLVLPWQRMKVEFTQRDDWITHGFPESFEAKNSYERSDLPAFPFNHTAVTLKDRDISIKTLADLEGLTLILVENFQYPLLDDYIDQASRGETTEPIGVLRAFSPRGALEMLRHGRGDVVIDWHARSVYNLSAAGLLIEDVEFHDATHIVPTKNIHLIFSRQQPEEIKALINQRMRVLTDSGKLNELVEKYYTPAQTPDY
jgi:polar amino acid transport system substrate-binding protein